MSKNKQNKAAKAELDEEKLLSVLCDMNPDDDEQWLQSGEPRLSYLEEATGAEVTQKIVQKVYHGFSRSELAEMDKNASVTPPAPAKRGSDGKAEDTPDAPGGNPLVPEVGSTQKTEGGVLVQPREVVAVLENGEDENDESFQTIQDELELLEDAAARQRIRRDLAVRELANIQKRIDEKMKERNERFPPRSQAAVIKEFTARQVENRAQRFQAMQQQVSGGHAPSALDQALRQKNSRPSFAQPAVKKE